MTVLIASTSAPQKGRRRPRLPAARSSRKAARHPWSARRPWSAAGRSSRPDRPAPATSGSPRRPRETPRASRSGPPPSRRARAPRSPAARRAGPAAPRPACDPPSCADPGPEPRPLRYLRSPRPRLLRAQSHPSQHTSVGSDKPSGMSQRTLGRETQHLFAAARVLPRHEAEPGCEVAPAPEALHRWREGLDRRGADRSNAGHGH